METRLAALAAAVADGGHDNDHSALRVLDHVYVSKGMGDCVLVTGSDADVAINAGLPEAGACHRARFDRVSRNSLAYLMLTQSHVNQYGGAYALKHAATRVIAQAR